MISLHYILYLALIGTAFITGLYRAGKNKYIRPVVFLLGITFLSEVLAKILAYTIRNNSVVYHIYHPIQLSLWGGFFYLNMQSKWRTLVRPIWGILLLLGVINSCFIQDLSVFPGNFIKLECIALLFWSFCLFFEFLDRPSGENIFKNNVFIITVAVIWFNLVSYLFFLLFNYFSSRPKPVFSLVAIHYFSNYVYYTILLASMALKTKRQIND